MKGLQIYVGGLMKSGLCKYMRVDFGHVGFLGIYGDLMRSALWGDIEGIFEM